MEQVDGRELQEFFRWKAAKVQTGKRQAKREPRRAPVLGDSEIAGCLLQIESARRENAREGWRAYRDAAMIEVMAIAGLRRGEIAGLTWGNITDGPEGATVLRFVGKGDKERVIEIRNRLGRLGAWKRKAPKGDYVFCGPAGRQLTVRSVEGIINKRFAFTGRAISCHSLRRTAGTKAAVHGGIMAAQKLLGHSNPATTHRYLDLNAVKVTGAITNIAADYADAESKLVAERKQENNRKRQARHRTRREKIHLVKTA